VYLSHRQFLGKHHTLRKKGKHFNGKANHWDKTKEHIGVDVFNMVKDMEVIFGKGPGGKKILHDADGHTHVEGEIYILGA
jgi:hypothetical protein